MSAKSAAAAGAVAGLALAAAIGFFWIAPPLVDARMNTVDPPPSEPVPEAARRLHETLFIADLHSDLLLWSRDPLRRYDRGHTDLPRLREGNTALQVFSVVTKVPFGQNYEQNDSTSDLITPLAVAQWPLDTWSDLHARALHQARRLRIAAERSGGSLVILRNREDLDRFVSRRASERDLVGALLALEGVHAMDGELTKLDALYDAGFRMMGLAHFFDNELAGSAHGLEKGGLTPLGRDAVRRMEALGIAVDLAHASPATIEDVLAIATRPVVVSHTGVRRTCPTNRNLSDDQLRAIAGNGAVVGIGVWPGATCGRSARHIARAIAHAVRVAGADHVALGSDFDGTTLTPFDAAGLPRLTGALLAEGLDEPTIRKVMGENVLRLLRETLPSATGIAERGRQRGALNPLPNKHRSHTFAR